MKLILNEKRVSRRDFLRMIGLTSGGIALGALGANTSLINDFLEDDPEAQRSLQKNNYVTGDAIATPTGGAGGGTGSAYTLQEHNIEFENTGSEPVNYYFKVAKSSTGTSTTGTESSSSSSTNMNLPSVNADNIVNLGEEGLSEGDRIGPYIERHAADNTIIEIPAGNYRLEDDSSIGFGEKSNFGVKGVGGQVILEQPEGANLNLNIRATSGVVRFDNLTFKNRLSEGTHSFMADEGTKIVLNSYNRPDGTSDGGQGILIPMDWHANGEILNEGDIIINDSHLEDFSDNGIYASGPGYRCPDEYFGGRALVGGQGSVKIYNTLAKNNNISNMRIGGNDSIIKDSKIVVDDRAPGTPTAFNMRGLWIRGGGNNQEVNNLEIVYTHTGEGSSTPIMIQPHCGGSGVIKNSSIQNGTDNKAIDHRGGDWSCQNTEITGTGNTNSDLQC